MPPRTDAPASSSRRSDTRPGPALQALVSVRSLDEALLAARAGVTLIDLKEPRDGPLGALPLALLRTIVTALRAEGHRAEISATVGDAVDPAGLRERVRDTAASGVDRVKVGLWPISAARAQLEVLAGLAAEPARPGDRPARIVPVLLAEPLFSDALLAAALALPVDTVMLDTRDKAAGSVFERLAPLDLRRFVASARQAGRRVGIAGALRLDDLPRLKGLRPDFAGFRSAVCDGDRGGALSAERLQRLLQGLPQRPAAAASA